MTDHYTIKGRRWDVSDEAEQCTACETMSFIFIYHSADGKTCWGCADCVERRMEGVAHV